MSDEEIAHRLEGKTVVVMFKVPGTKRIFEDTHKVKRFRRMLEPDGDGRKQRIVQFWADAGGLRTIAISDIVQIR